jgi:hypothetical protein
MRLGCLGLRSAAVPIFASSNEKPKEVQAEKKQEKETFKLSEKDQKKSRINNKSQDR